jgi:hypothetical protein
LSWVDMISIKSFLSAVEHLLFLRIPLEGVLKRVL